MSPKLRIAYCAHSVRSDWNNGNAHFLRGLLRAMSALGHTVLIFEPETSWSVVNLAEEVSGASSLRQFHAAYPKLAVHTYGEGKDLDSWWNSLSGVDIVILHEWTTPTFARMMLALRSRLGFALVFHDTHHRALSSPEQLERIGIRSFDGVVVFGNVLRDIYKGRFGITRLWVLHEAADVAVFKPQAPLPVQQDVVWIGNWGDEERSVEIGEFLLGPVSAKPELRVTIYGVRYPEEGIRALKQAGVRYGGYLPNLEAPAQYASSGITVHIPRRHYATTMPGIPTIRVFEALACGIPLISAPWQDAEQLFRPGDFTFVRSGQEMELALDAFRRDPTPFMDLAQQGLETILSYHTCEHRAIELTSICHEVLQ